jgi:hypothetical protein
VAALALTILSIWVIILLGPPLLVLLAVAAFYSGVAATVVAVLAIPFAIGSMLGYAIGAVAAATALTALCWSTGPVRRYIRPAVLVTRFVLLAGLAAFYTLLSPYVLGQGLVALAHEPLPTETEAVQFVIGWLAYTAAAVFIAGNSWEMLCEWRTEWRVPARL